MDNFKGTKYRLSDKWTNIIHIDKTQPINYLEIGVFFNFIIRIYNIYNII